MPWHGLPQIRAGRLCFTAAPPVWVWCMRYVICAPKLGLRIADSSCRCGRIYCMLYSRRDCGDGYTDWEYIVRSFRGVGAMWMHASGAAREVSCSPNAEVRRGRFILDLSCASHGAFTDSEDCGSGVETFQGSSCNSFCRNGYCRCSYRGRRSLLCRETCATSAE